MADGNFKIFVVEDNEWYNKLLVHSLQLNPDYEIDTFHNAKSFLKKLHLKPNVVTLDYRLPDSKGDQLLKEIKAFDPGIEVVIISEQEDIETAVELLKLGAFDYLIKSKDIAGRLLNTINHIKNNVHLKDEIKSLKKDLQIKYDFNSIIGQSTPIKQVFDLMSKSLNTNINVTVTGETGTGKELVAKAIHFNSVRKDKPFVSVNMAAIPQELIESELFGHEKGAFTGAITRRIGKFEEAKDGTLFLDEMGEMDINSQAKLLRALQEREITRVGGNDAIKTNCRLIVATHKNLKEEVKKERFREDLYYRLFGLTIELPPLRERGDDILILSKHFLDNFAKDNQLPSKTLDDFAKKKLLNYNWPGNVRELKSVIELAFVMSDTDQIQAEDITLHTSEDITEITAQDMSMREYNRMIVKIFMKKFHNDTKKVAEKLDIGQTTVYRLLKEDQEEA